MAARAYCVGYSGRTDCYSDLVFCVHERSPLIFITSDKGRGTCFCTCSFVCLSDVCLSVSKITQNACVDLDEILRVDRCRDMDELINFRARS